VWKIAVPSKEDPTGGIVQFLERNHFDAAVTTTDVPLIRAQKDLCRLQIINLDSDGSNQELARELANHADRSFVVFRGRVYDRQPIFLTRINAIWSERLRELGLVKHVDPLLAVSVNGSCNAKELPWHELDESF
jgi:hypothetical protein